MADLRSDFVEQGLDVEGNTEIGGQLGEALADDPGGLRGVEAFAGEVVPGQQEIRDLLVFGVAFSGRRGNDESAFGIGFDDLLDVSDARGVSQRCTSELAGNSAHDV